MLILRDAANFRKAEKKQAGHREEDREGESGAPGSTAAKARSHSS
jgi:hypothetical protein